MTNQFPGLARGPIDHGASSVINAVADGPLDMGSTVLLTDVTSFPAELLPRVEETPAQTNQRIYGIAVGGDADGVYGDGSPSTDDSTRATTSAGQGVVIVTKGRCLARVEGKNTNGPDNIEVGDPLTSDDFTAGGLIKSTLPGELVVARALQPVSQDDVDIIAIDFQREGRRI